MAREIALDAGERDLSLYDPGDVAAVHPVVLTG
jgi:hypothetical protein